MPVPPTDPSSPDDAPTERVVEGIGVAPGIAIGRVSHYRPSAPAVERVRIEPDEVGDELARLDEAVHRAEQEVERIQSIAQRTLGPEGVGIFEAQQMMLHDDDLFGAIRDRIRNDHASAGHALETVLEDHRARLEASDDAYLRGRASDLLEMEARLIRALQEGTTDAVVDPDSILVADALTAADILRFNEQGVLGCVTTTGGATSHVSILARALALPAVVGAAEALDAAQAQRPAVLDGTQGRLVVDPSAETLHTYRRREARHRSVDDRQARAVAGPAETTDGHRITVRANVEFGGEVETLSEHGAEGIGLLRTEMMFLGRPEGTLAEDRQLTVYREAADTAAPHPATVRLLDLGGDKLLAEAQQDPNPALGWRGIRLLLDRTDDLLRPQLRALLRANTHGPLRALLPMISHLDELRRVRALVAEEADRLAAQEVDHDPDLPIGVMLEVPAVALQTNAFAEAADFLSIGTNDLTQYVLAVDRGNPRVADRYDALHPAVLRLVRRVAAAGRAAGTPVSLCGEVAGDPEAVPILIGLGLPSLSVLPSRIPTLKRIVRSVARDDAESLADDACAAPDAETVRQRVRRWLDAHLDASVYDPHAPDTP